MGMVVWWVVSDRDNSVEEELPESVTWCVIDPLPVEMEGEYPGRLLVAAGKHVFEVNGEEMTWCLEVSEDVDGCYWLSPDVVVFWISGNGAYVVDHNGFALWRCLDFDLTCACPTMEGGVDRLVVGTSQGEVYETTEEEVGWRVVVSEKLEVEEPHPVDWVSRDVGGHAVTLGSANKVILVGEDGELGGSWGVISPRRAQLLSSGDVLVCSDDGIMEIAEGGGLVWKELSGASQAQWLPCGVLLVCGEDEAVGRSSEGGALWRLKMEELSSIEGSL